MKSNTNKNGSKADYNRIAAQFASTRRYSWPEMRTFVGYVKDGWKILDLGCGNGRLLSSLESKNVDYLGIDASEALIKIASENHPEKDFRVMDMAQLTLKDGSFDATFMIASLHHLPNKEARIKALNEANRVLIKDGYIFITVWNLWQKKYRKYIWENLFEMLFKGSGTQFGDTLIPWKDSGRNILAERYYFAYTKRKLKNELETCGFETLEIAKSRWNIYAICRKR